MIHCPCGAVLLFHWLYIYNFWLNFPLTVGVVGFQIAVLGMSNVALEELCGPEVEEFLDQQFSRVVDTHRQGQKTTFRNCYDSFSKSLVCSQGLSATPYIHPCKWSLITPYKWFYPIPILIMTRMSPEDYRDTFWAMLRDAIDQVGDFYPTKHFPCHSLAPLLLCFLLSNKYHRSGILHIKRKIRVNNTHIWPSFIHLSI